MGRLTHTVSGSIATVRSPAVAPIESLKVHFSPIQEGTGDPSPSNIRPITGWTGVGTTKVHNIWDGRYEAGLLNSDGSEKSGASNFRNIGYIPVKPGRAIHFNFTKTTATASNVRIFRYNSNKEYINDHWVAPTSVYIVGENDRYMRFYMDTGYTAAYVKDDFIMYYRDEAETIPVTFPAVGKNKLDVSAIELKKWRLNSNVFQPVLDSSTAIVYSSSNDELTLTSTSKYFGIGFEVEPCQVERVVSIPSSFGRVQFWSAYEDNATRINTGEVSCIIPANTSGFVGLRYDAVGTITTKVQLELGSTATAYEPYNPDNTVYGGYVDLVNGNIIAGWAKVSINKTRFGNIKTGPANISYRDFVDTKDLYLKSKTDATSWNKARSEQYSSICKVANPYSETSYGTYIGVVFTSETASSGHLSMRISDDLYQTLTDSDNIDFVYELATSKLIATLTPQELVTFKGYTNFWSNAGDVDVTYQVVESSEMTKERQKIFAGNAPTIHTASGSIANFEMEPGLNRNLKSCKVGFLPVQEGSGDPSHANVRPIIGWSKINTRNYNKNELNITASTLTQRNGMNYTVLKDENDVKRGVLVEGQRTNNNAFFNFNYVNATTLSIAPGSYKVSGYTKDIGFRVFIINSQSTDECVFNSEYGNTNVFTIPSDAQASWIRIQVVTADYICAYVYPVLVKYDAELNSYPITFPVQGKNLFDGQYVKGVITGNPTIGYTWNNVNTNANSAIIKCSPNTTYTIKKHSSSNRFSVATCSHYPATNDSLNLIVEDSNISQYTCTTGNDAEYLIVYVSTGTEQAEPDLMVELGSSASAYGPYDNSILGGYVDLVSGDIVTEWSSLLVSDLEWSYTTYSDANVFWTKKKNTGIKERTTANDIYFEKAPSLTYVISMVTFSTRTSPTISQYLNAVGDPRFAIKDDSLNGDVSTFLSKYGSSRIVFKLAEPIKIGSVSSTQIQALKGTNNILSDANGIIEVKYWSH